MLSTVWWSPPSRSKCIPWPPWWFAIEGGDIGPCGLHFVEATQNSMIRVDGVRNPAPPVPVFCKKKTWNRGGGGVMSFEQKHFLKWRGQDSFRKIKTVMKINVQIEMVLEVWEHWVVTVSEMYSLKLFLQGKGATPNLWLRGVAYYWTSDNPQIYSTRSVHACTCILVFCLETCMRNKYFCMHTYSY